MHGGFRDEGMSDDVGVPVQTAQPQQTPTSALTAPTGRDMSPDTPGTSERGFSLDGNRVGNKGNSGKSQKEGRNRPKGVNHAGRALRRSPSLMETP